MDWPRVTVFQVPVRAGSSVGLTGSVMRVLSGITSYEQSIAVNIGYESCQVTFAATLTDALFWLNQLRAGMIATGPDAETIWEGYLTSVNVQLGALQQSLSLDGMANRVRVRYTTTTGVPGATATASDTASIARYGTRDMVLSVGVTTATVAGQARTTALAQYKNPRASGGSTISTGESGSESTITLTFAGWGSTLDWVLTSRTDTSTEQTTTQITDLLAGTGVGIGTVNAFIASTVIITASGVNDTRFIAPDTTYRQKIDDLVSRGTSGGQRLVWGMYAGRKVFVQQWAGATPSTINYWVNQQARAIYGGVLDGRTQATAPPIATAVLPWNVRPNAMAALVELYDPGPVSTAQDATNRFFVERVTCRIDASGYSVTLEPGEQTGLDAILARIA